MMANKHGYAYGKSPAPKDWHETADVLKQINKAKPGKKDKSGLSQRMQTIEKLLKERAK